MITSEPAIRPLTDDEKDALYSRHRDANRRSVNLFMARLHSSAQTRDDAIRYAHTQCCVLGWNSFTKAAVLAAIDLVTK